MSQRFRNESAQAAVLVILVFAVYIPAIRGGFIWDDEDYVYGNRHLQTVEGLQDIWFTENALPQYYPLVHTTYWLEYRAWGLDPRGYHFVNVALHIFTALCLWRLLKLLALPGAWSAAMVFAIHPVHVESVAWITERKNVLSGLFFVLAAIWYLRFENCKELPEDERVAPRYQWSWYIGAYVLFLAALLSKTVTCSLPAALLLIIWFKTSRITVAQVGLLAPMFAMGIAFALRTAQIEREFVGATGTEFDWTLAERCLIAGRAVWFYAWKLFWPHPLSFFYVKWSIDVASWIQWAFPLSAIVLVSLLWMLRKRIGRGPLTAALYFGGTLIPALGFVNIYPMRFSFVADHFQYLASIGLITLVTSTAILYFEQFTNKQTTVRSQTLTRWLAGISASLIICCLGTLTWQHAYILGDMERLFRDTLTKNPGSVVAHNHLGLILRQRGDHAEALEHFRAAAQFGPRNDPLNEANILATEGELLLAQAQTSEAIKKFEAAISLAPQIGRVYFFLAEAYSKSQDYQTALSNSQLAIHHGYQYPQTFIQNAQLHERLGDANSAIASYRRAVSMSMDPISASELAWILATHWDEKVRNLDEAYKLAAFAADRRPNSRAFDALAAIEAMRGRQDAAVFYISEAYAFALRDASDDYLEEIRLRKATYLGGGHYLQTQSGNNAAAQPRVESGTSDVARPL